MKIIKLDAIGSTNSFLKDMSAKVLLDNFTVVVARNQTLGRGQVNANWKSEGGKNLTFSVFCRPEALCIADFKYLNYSVSLSVYELLISLKLPRLAIKWPNDILSENKKIAGILIENTLNIKNISTSIIGIGLNVNQNIFSDALPNASSVKRILKKEQDIDLDLLLDKLLLILKKKLVRLNKKEYVSLEKEYLNVLYKKNVPSMFKTNQNILFMGKIIGVSDIGKLQIELENETIQEFGIKEVSFA
ncbi:biotin--[acetyl-CoA-carboxylase] ligase [Tenacibaculum dicentrarchi]|uniref:BPL/LPL catalytic domain-containing protein n=1 Tax=Tenacibaculum dicentrarchi TaxID=669041 RepID=A0ABP1ELA0_9FLAO|nr:biotin--[acetyl-CoA-carboxylase] ligase [Tenacibaculum dicentrarchi]MCD8406368.1 biotin--[acetyl-CoA-carboxylase] ligase [Tenacibaculum dicentrarchi]MCD8415346.1 biotin--[acetyl-CoA-carboxylase] ligase [Tenacibaculum dicentrarchi]MCD8420552.1 biotin--[acetyl-CoA-carboxylase] ligase [Tenacibaculum dicentrarchi]MCD8423741.1 biotin--[acetyl-CoA-carboxylase] ligase [Tenacibaculum dicentrarchi]